MGDPAPIWKIVLISWENNRDCHITMPLSLKKMEVQIKGDKWNRRFTTMQVYWDGLPNFLSCGAPLSRVKHWCHTLVGVIRYPTSLTSMLLGLKPKMRYCHLFCLKVIDMTMFKSFLSWICIRRLVTVGFSRLKNREESLRHVSRSHGSKISWWQPNRKFTYKVNSHYFKLNRSYSISFYLSNVGEIFWGRIRKDHISV